MRSTACNREPSSGGNCLGRLADYLLAQKNPIVHQWVAAVREHPGIPSADSLTFKQLADHLPILFDDLANILRSEPPVPVPESRIAITKVDAQMHGRHRWQQGFRLGELLRELTAIRRLIIRHVLEAFCAECPECEMEVRREARDLIELFFEETASASIEQFVEEQQEKLHEANSNLVQAESSRVRLLGTVAHELGNTLYSLKMVVEVLVRNVPHPAERERTLAMSKAAFAEVDTFLRQLIDYTALLRHEQVDVQRFDLLTLFEELATAFRPPTEAAGMHLEVYVDSKLTWIESDRRKIKQIANNLLTNAIKFGGRVDGSRGCIRLTALPLDSTNWKLAVTDEGKGIPPADQQRIFEEFARLDGNAPQADGSGLGLAITKRLVRLLGGIIRIDSKEGKGSSFEAVLPLVSPTEPPP